jgi:hypothetical protein
MKKRAPRVRGPIEAEEDDQPPEITSDMTVRQAAEVWRQVREWSNNRRTVPPLHRAPVKPPGLRPNELFINTAFATRPGSGRNNTSYFEKMVDGCMHKAITGNLSAADALMDLYFDSDKADES